MLVKMLDLCDTMYLILRNEFHQVTFSHVYRRLMMLFITWVCLKYDGTSVLWAFVGMVHSALLVPMYLADALVILGPRAARFAWWRKYFPAVYMVRWTGVLLNYSARSLYSFWSIVSYHHSLIAIVTMGCSKGTFTSTVSPTDPLATNACLPGKCFHHGHIKP